MTWKWMQLNDEWILFYGLKYYIATSHLLICFSSCRGRLNTVPHLLQLYWGYMKRFWQWNFWWRSMFDEILKVIWHILHSYNLFSQWTPWMCFLRSDFRLVLYGHEYGQEKNVIAVADPINFSISVLSVDMVSSTEFSFKSLCFTCRDALTDPVFCERWRCLFSRFWDDQSLGIMYTESRISLYEETFLTSIPISCMSV